MQMQTEDKSEIPPILRPSNDPDLLEADFEIFESAAENEDCDSDDANSKQDAACTSGKSSWQFIDGMRGVELVDSKCYRTPHGFQKEATFPCQPFFSNASSLDSGESESSSHSSSTGLTQDAAFPRKGPLERFTLMIGENILHFKIVTACEQGSNDGNDAETWSSSSECECSLCGKILPSKAVWEKHITSTHCCSVKDLHCDTCGAIFRSKVSLALHMRLHPGPKPFRCTICTKTFTGAASLTLHMKLHIMGHRHFCQICGRSFKSVAALSDHENTCLSALNGDVVNVSRPFRWQCMYCEKMFHHRRDKNIHERVHTGEKPYTCGYCGRGFTQSQSLTIHIRTHTGEKPYPCNICGQEFRDSSALRKHEFSKHTNMASSSASSIYDDSTIEDDVGEDGRLWNGRIT